MATWLVDAQLVVTDWIVAELCYIALVTCKPITVQQHYGFIVGLKRVGESTHILLAHTGGPQLCDCKEEPQRYDDL